MLKKLKNMETLKNRNEELKKIKEEGGKMNKYNHLKFLKKTKARVEHECYQCGQLISTGDFYYAERLKDAFLHTLHNKKFCTDCYKKYGDSLLK